MVAEVLLAFNTMKRKPKVIFTIEVFRKDPRFPKGYCYRDWGYYFRLSDAVHVIEHNETDISELNYYQYAILCSKSEGPLAIPEPIQWYKFFWKKKTPTKMSQFIKAKKIRCPKVFNGLYIHV